MAYDKVVDSAVLEAAIKASADAIREKTGETALIPWLQDKGFAEAIAAIEAGGGSGGGVSVKNGKIVPSEDVASMEIPHNLGVVPDLIICTLNGALATSNCINYVLLVDGFIFDPGMVSDWLFCIKGGSSSSRFTYTKDNVSIPDISTTDTITLDLSGRTNTMFFAGKDYYWFAFAGVAKEVVH